MGLPTQLVKDSSDSNSCSQPLEITPDKGLRRAGRKVRQTAGAGPRKDGAGSLGLGRQLTWTGAGSRYPGAHMHRRSAELGRRGRRTPGRTARASGCLSGVASVVSAEDPDVEFRPQREPLGILAPLRGGVVRGRLRPKRHATFCGRTCVAFESWERRVGV